ncbi:MAG: N-acetylneuraminate synthase [Desulfuromonadales bacterium]|nr:N-acetylneuraminate synthase [Desulfuromonadales bacterium]MDW7756466.1 N-acetylneuraminate synthase [Desulfuromonadales bacterium]
MTDRCYIIAEAGVNHNGSLAMAKRLVEVAAEAGADAVKFQTFKAAELIIAGAPKAAYQIDSTGAEESQWTMISRLELDAQAHANLVAHCQNCAIQFLSTPFDAGSAEMLVEMFDMPIIKVPSGEVTNAPLLLKVAQFRRPLIVSTGMCTLADVTAALGVLAYGLLYDSIPNGVRDFEDAFKSAEGQHVLREKVTLLHCTTEYPAPYAEVNLRAMEALSKAFGLPVGFSDHTEGVAVAIAAAARGAKVVEKHFTLDRSLPGPDHKASLEPQELANMVRGIRQVEQALGEAVKAPTISERKNMEVARKSLVARCAIRAGEVFSEDNLGVKRPGKGLSPMNYWELIGRVASRDFQPDELIEL